MATMTITQQALEQSTSVVQPSYVALCHFIVFVWFAKGFLKMNERFPLRILRT
jgi:hypothetical protein